MSRKRIRNKADEVLEKVNAKLDISEDKFDVAGKNIANKLRDLPREAALMADKLISDVLFEAALGNITRNTKMSLTNELIPQQQSQAATHPFIQLEKNTNLQNNCAGRYLSDFTVNYLDLE